jgi:CHAT domain-containing protein
VAALRCQVDPGTCGQAAAAARRGDGGGTKPAVRDATIPPFDLDAAYSLYRDLIAPVEGALKGVDQVFVTADGPLSGLPLGLLVTKPPAAGTDNGSSAALAAAPWLADRYALTTLPSVSSLRAFNILRTTAANRPAFRGYGDPVLLGASLSVAPEALHRGGGTVALANPEMLRRGLEPLPHTREELMAMAQALGAPPSSLRLGAEATETAVKTEADIGAARVVAFATHGLIPTVYNTLDEPGLVMTPPVQATAQDDGYLSASEAAGLKLSADWLILSACNTAAASGKPEAESLSGLARAFLYAGAKALLASHWSVLDDATEALMIETLSGQRRDPSLTKAQALQRAMAAVRTGRRADGAAVPGWTPLWAHPAAWAPFVLIGAGE